MKKIFMICLMIGFVFTSFSQETKTMVPTDAKDICPILIGENLPDGKVANLDNENVSIADITKEKLSIIVFYRGGWCPYCNSQLAGLNEIQEQIDSLGFQVLAFSPDSPKKLNNTKEKNELKYQLLSDKKMLFAKKLGIAFKVDKETVERYKKYGIELEESGNQLPAPAVFVVDKEGVIQFSYINPNYKVRLDSKILLAVLESVSGK